jgi:1-acyl-sn-glycerol-3-phosphate acyltransferase
MAERDLVHCHWEGFGEAADWTGSIVVANHPSILDALCFFWKLPGIGCVVGSNPWGNPLLSNPARRADFVPCDPAMRMFKEGRRRLARGENILLFPEGTRTTQGTLNSFHAGPALLAVKSGAPVRTVFIECNSLFLGKEYSFFQPTPRAIEFRFSTGEVLRPDGSESARAFARRMEDHYRARLRREGDRIFRVRP